MLLRKWSCLVLPARDAALPFSMAAATIALLVGVTPASAAVLVNDTWQDGTDTDPAPPAYSEYGLDTDLDGDLESVWFQGGAGTLNPVAAGGPLRGAGFGTNSASWTTYFTPEALPVTLANSGDFIKATWVFTTANVNSSNGNQNFRIALVDSPSAARLTENGTPGTATYPGYAMLGNMGETTGHNSSFQLRERNGSGDFLSSTGAWTSLANGLGNGAVGYADNTQYTFMMTLTRNATNGLDIAMNMAGGNIGGTGSVSVNFTDTTPNSFVYDTFGVRPSSETTTSTVFDTNLFRIESNTVQIIPEPASLLLFGLGAMGLAILRRRRGC